MKRDKNGSGHLLGADGPRTECRAKINKRSKNEMNHWYTEGSGVQFIGKEYRNYWRKEERRHLTKSLKVWCLPGKNFQCNSFKVKPSSLYRYKLLSDIGEKFRKLETIKLCVEQGDISLTAGMAKRSKMDSIFLT